MTESTIKIFSVFHKAFEVPQCDFIAPIQVGKANSSTDLGFIGDDDGDNISAKNPTFCEMTALYWIWKNLALIDANYIGLAHYRRYFCLPENKLIKKWGITKTAVSEQDAYHYPVNQISLEKVSNDELKNELLKDLNAGSVIMPKPMDLFIEAYPAHIRMHYVSNHIIEDWWILNDVIKGLYPDYAGAFDEFSLLKQMYCYNMFIGDKEFIRKYCEWLFPILFEMEKRVKLSEYPYQSRIFGFLPERLINLYLHKNKLQVTSYPILQFS